MFKMCCGDCGECWWVGNTRTCKCLDEAPKREWVGLTDEEIEELAKWADKNAAPWHIGFARAVLKAAKEKNT